MNANLALPNWNAVVSTVLGVAGVVFVAAYLLGWKAPPITTDRAAFFALAALGFGMCSLGMSQIAIRLGWTHPVTLVGCVLGGLLLLLVIARWAGWAVPFINTDRAAFIALASLGLAKWALAFLSRAWLMR